MTRDVQLRIIRALPFTGDTGWNHRGISDPYHTVYFVLEGDGHIGTETGVMDLVPGNAYLIPRTLSHDLWCDSHIRKTYIDLHMELFPGYDVLTNADRVLTLSVGENVCRSVYDAALQNNTRARTYLRGQLLMVLAEFMPMDMPDISPQMIPFLPIIEEIQQHLSSSIRRDDFARRYGWNPSSFSRSFHKAFGCGFKATPHNSRFKTQARSCLHLFRHTSQKCSPIHKVLAPLFVSSDEKSDCAISHLELCGIALNSM